MTGGDTNRKSSRAARFREILEQPGLDFLMEAHNGLSARIGEETGFKGLWASGLCLSAQFGVRDSNEASWTQVLEMLEFMTDATRLPILLDGDTGYGNFNNVRRLIRKLEQRGIAAVCIEDKLFPKTNSFIDGSKQELADIDEFCGRIKAGKDAQGDDDFCLVTRVEALIAGWGLSEALKRAEAYHAAGSDAILIHSSLASPREVLAFKREWGNRLPVVIVPTRYYKTPTPVFRDAGFSLVIWANHVLRAAVSAMQNCARTIYENESVLGVEGQIAGVGEIFRLQGAAELQLAEDLYLPQPRTARRAIVLAASRGSALSRLTDERPKTMVDIKGRPLLQHIVDAYNSVGVKDISVVRGYRKEAVNLPNLNYVDNDDYTDTSELVSLGLALDVDHDDTADLFVCYGDVLFSPFLLEMVEAVEEPFSIIVDADWRYSANRARAADYVTCTEPYTRQVFQRQVLLTAAGEGMDEAEIHGEWTGILRASAAAIPALEEAVSALLKTPEARTAKLHHLLCELVRRGNPTRVLFTWGRWLDVDSLDDVVAAGNFG